MGETTIEWTDKSWNPVRGCTEISPGCAHCYAKTFAERWRGVKGHAYERGFDPRMAPDQLDAPLRWKKPVKIFTASMSDLYLDDFPFEYIAAVHGVMAAAPRHTFQVLTKRAARMLEFHRSMPAFAEKNRAAAAAPDEVQASLNAAHTFLDQAWMLGRNKPALDAAWVKASDLELCWPLPNVWQGVSVENRKHGVPRIELLRQVPAVVRFLSCEPLLEDLGVLDLTGIHWVIIGGESGQGARAFNPDWARSIIRQCRAQGVAVFVKQMGARIVDRNDVGFEAEHDVVTATGMPTNEQAWPTPKAVVHDIHGYRDEHQGADVLVKLKSRKGGDMVEWPTDLRIREMPTVRP